MLLGRSLHHCFSILLFRKFKEYDDRFLHFPLILAPLIGPTDHNRLDDSEKSSRGGQQGPDSAALWLSNGR
jgi:hypothetical protein